MNNSKDDFRAELAHCQDACNQIIATLDQGLVMVNVYMAISSVLRMIKILNERLESLENKP